MDKVDILNKMLKQRNDLNQQIDMILKLEVKPVTEDEWHEICLTPARHTNMMCELAKAIFPNGKDFKRNTNEVTFKLNGFDVSIPTCAIKGVKIDTHWYKHEYAENVEIKSEFINMRKYFNLIDSKNYTWYDLALCRCNHRKTKSSKLKLFIWWFTKAKWHKVDRENWEVLFEKEDRYFSEKIKQKEKLKKDMEIKIPLFHKTVDQLKKFAEVKGYAKDQLGVYMLMNIENFLRGEVNE